MAHFLVVAHRLRPPVENILESLSFTIPGGPRSSGKVILESLICRLISISTSALPFSPIRPFSPINLSLPALPIKPSLPDLIYVTLPESVYEPLFGFGINDGSSEIEYFEIGLNFPLFGFGKNDGLLLHPYCRLGLSGWV